MAENETEVLMSWQKRRKNKLLDNVWTPTKHRPSDCNTEGVKDRLANDEIGRKK